MAPQIEVGIMRNDGCTCMAGSMYPTLLSSPRHAPGGSAEIMASSAADSTEVQKVHVDRKTGEESRGITAFMEAIKVTTSQPGAAPKRYAQKPKRSLSATDRTLSVSALTNAVRMAYAPGGCAKNTKSQSADGGIRNVHVDRDAVEGSLRMTTFIKMVKPVTSQPGCAPKRYAQKAKVGLGTADSTLRMSALIDAVRTSMRKSCTGTQRTPKLHRHVQ